MASSLARMSRTLLPATARRAFSSHGNSIRPFGRRGNGLFPRPELDAFVPPVFSQLANSMFDNFFGPALPDMRRMSKEMDERMGSMWGRNALSVDLSETATEYKIHVDVPGVSKENLRVEVDEDANVLHIGAEKSERVTSHRGAHDTAAGTSRVEAATPDATAQAGVQVAKAKDEAAAVSSTGREGEDGVTWHRTERYFGTMSRSLAMPENANLAAIKADLSNGVLTLTIPKREPTSAKASRKSVSITSSE